MPRYVILAHKSFDYIYSKTGNMLIRYRPEDVCAVIDSSQSGKTAKDVLGWGGSIPCVANFNEAKQFSPTHLVIGSAPQGGVLDKHSLMEIDDAIDHGCSIISGMHNFLKDDPSLLKRSEAKNISLVDLRKPPSKPHFPKGTWRDRKFPVLLVVGSDCDTGKMTTAWEISELLKKNNWNVEFLGTGQTGILLSGNGVPIDAVISDFMAGEIEYCLDQFSEDTDLVLVEGQGALNNMFYSGVTLGLIHGCMPDFLIMTDEPNRDFDVSGHPIPGLKQLMDLHLDILRPFKDSLFLGLNLLTLKLEEDLALKYINDAKDQFDLPVTDLVRFDASEMIQSIENAMRKWK